MKHRTMIGCFSIALLLMSLLYFVGDVEADAILFPWIVKSDTVSTILSVVNTGGSDIAGYDGDELHYQYFYKESISNWDTEKCATYAFYRETSKNDLVTFDAAGQSIMNAGMPLYNDGSPYNSKHFDLQGVSSPRRAFLIVDNNTDALVESGGNSEGTLYGEALLIDHVTGMLWGYTAYNAKGGGVASKPYLDVFFNDGMDSRGEVIGGTEKERAVFLPPIEFVTRFYITPIGLNGQRVGDARTTIQLVIDDDTGGVYDNDENVFDFEVKHDTVCTGIADLEKLMPASVYGFFAESGRQGWAYIRTDMGTVTDDLNVNLTDEAVIGKLEWTLFPFGQADFSWISNSESIQCKTCQNDCLAKCKIYGPQPNNNYDKKCLSKCIKKCSRVCDF